MQIRMIRGKTVQFCGPQSITSAALHLMGYLTPNEVEASYSA